MRNLHTNSLVFFFISFFSQNFHEHFMFLPAMFSRMFSPMFSHAFSPMPAHYSPSICSTQYHASDCGQNWPYGPDSQSEGRWIHGLDFLSVGAKRLGEALLWGFWPSALQWVFLWLDLHIHLMRLFTHVVGHCWKMTRSRESLFFVHTDLVIVKAL